MMRRYNPFEELEQMFERTSRQLDEMGRGFDGSAGEFGGMDIDLSDYDDEIVVVADLPGFDREEIDVTVSDRTLTVSAERESETESESDTDGGEYLRRERTHSSMRRRVHLPEPVDEEAAGATYTNGVLTITLPKMGAGNDEDVRRIDVE